MEEVMVIVTAPADITGSMIFTPKMRRVLDNGNVEIVGTLTDPLEKGDPLQIVARAARMFEVGVSEVMSASRHKRVVAARSLVSWVLHEHWKWSYPDIGRYFDRDHTTIVNAVKRVHLLTTEFQRRRVLEAEAA